MALLGVALVVWLDASGGRFSFGYDNLTNPQGMLDASSRSWSGRHYSGI